MRNVSRTPKPESLRRNASRWTRELLVALATANRAGKRLPKGAYRYNQQDVLEALQAMYDGLCCYCEARVSHVAYEHIEHRRPKTRFPRYTYKWENLHLACPRCNIAKGEKWNSRKQILDAAYDRPITDHLTYQLGQSGVRTWPLTLRGETTIEHAKLDRDDLIARRNDVYWAIVGTIDKIRAARRDHSPQVRALVRELRSKTTGEYGSLIKWLIAMRLDRDATAA
jgi:uncharacterized protein (TIGR02646 family)